ncbi:MAG: asparagine synthase-related protein, partial [Planctomycetota bacterium]
MTDASPFPPHLEEKLARLRACVRQLESAVVAFSGGVDSTLVLAVARDVLKSRVLAVTARGAIYPSGELEDARELAAELGVEHLLLDTDALASDDFCANPPERCYLCKRAVFGKLVEVARARGFHAVIDGANADDPGDHRP